MIPFSFYTRFLDLRNYKSYLLMKIVEDHDEIENHQMRAGLTLLLFQLDTR